MKALKGMQLLLLLFSLFLLSESASIRKRYLLQKENGKYHLALLANPNNNGKATKNTEVEAKVPAGEKRDKERKKLKCEPPARCSVKKKASGGDYDSGGIFKR